MKRLYGLRFEAMGKVDDATQNYDWLTEEDGTDTVRPHMALFFTHKLIKNISSP